MLVLVDSHFLLVFSMRIVTVALKPIKPTSVESCNKTLQSLRFTQVKSIVY